MELGRAAQNLLALTYEGRAERNPAGSGDTGSGHEDRPQSFREGLDLLEIRILNLQRSFDLRSIAAQDRPFDDRVHEVRGVRRDPAQPEGIVLEVLLPGYTLGGRVVRPALVVVNRLT